MGESTISLAHHHTIIIIGGSTRVRQEASRRRRLIPPNRDSSGSRESDKRAFPSSAVYPDFLGVRVVVRRVGEVLTNRTQRPPAKRTQASWSQSTCQRAGAARNLRAFESRCIPGRLSANGFVTSESNPPDNTAVRSHCGPDVVPRSALSANGSVTSERMPTGETPRQGSRSPTLALRTLLSANGFCHIREK